jgi:hypothetical protein
MLLRQFKETGPLTIFLIVVTLIAVWASAFINLKGRFSLYFDLEPMPLYGLITGLIGTNPIPGLLFTMLLVVIMAFIMVNLNTSLFFINERTFLPALLYILLSGLFPQYQLMNPALFSGIFLMLAIKRIMESYRIQGTAYNYFDAGILVGTGSLFYANLIWFGLIIIIGIALLRTISVKEIAITLIGLATPFVITFGIYYVAGKDANELLSLVSYNLFGKIAAFEFSRLTIVVLSYVGFLSLRSLGFLFMVMNSKKIQSRKTFYLLLWILVISISVYFISPSVSVEIVWLAGIPVSYLLAHYFVFIRNKLVPEIFFSLLFILIGLIQFWYLW